MTPPFFQTQGTRLQSGLRRFGPTALLTILAFLAGAALTLLLHTQGKFITIEDLTILLFWVPPLLLLVCMSRISWPPPHSPLPRKAWPLIALAMVLVLFLFTSIIRHRWFYFLNWWPHIYGGNLFQSSAFWFVFLTATLLSLFLFRNRHTSILLGCALIIAQGAIFWRLWQVTGGAVLTRDDHPSFVFRLWQFSETFPQIMTYNPYWNGGVAEHAHLATGTLAPGLLLWPLWFFGDVPTVYTFGLGLIFIVIVPFIAVFSMKAVAGDRIAQWTAGFLALGVSQHFFLWLMQYGTIGANLVAAFVVPVGALLYRIVCLDQRSFWTGFLLVVSTCFLAFYPPGALMALPILLALLLNAPRWTWPKLRMLLWCGLAVLIVHSRTFIILLWHDDVFRFIQLPVTPAETVVTVSMWSMETLKEGWQLMLAHLREGHPILLVMGLVGAFFSPRSMIRSWYAPILIGYALLTGWGKFVAQELEVPRMAIPFMFAAIVPAALAVSSVLRTSHLHLGLLRAALVALLLVTGLNVYRIYGCEGAANYKTITPEMEQMVEWIKAEVPEDGRLLFAGRTVHGYGWGHVAIFPVMTGREMMACDYYHFNPKHVEYEYPPFAWLSSPESIFSFFDLYNVTALSTWHESWAEHFRAHPQWYEEVTPLGENWLKFFLVKRESSLFKQNQGHVRAHFNRLEITVENPHEEVVIAYNWAEGLRVSKPVELFPYHAGNGVTLIGMRPHGKQDIIVRYSRLL